MIKVVIVGCGAIASKRHAPACRSYEKESVKLGFFDPIRENAQALALCHDGEVYESLEEVLGDPQVKAVVICAPEKYHCDMTVKCLSAGLHVLCEKPMGMDMEQAFKMYREKEKAGRELAIAFSQRNYSEFTTARKMLLRGEIGRPIAFRTALSNPGVEYFVQGKREGFYDTNLTNVGDVMLNVGCHRIDLISWLFGKQIQKVLAYTPALDKRFSNGELIPQGDTAMVILQLEDGLAGMLWSSWCNYGGIDASMEIFGTNGSIKISADGRILLEKSNSTDRTEKTVLKTKEEQKGYYVTWNFLDFLVSGKPVEADARAGLNCMMVLDAIRRANVSGKWETVH